MMDRLDPGDEISKCAAMCIKVNTTSEDYKHIDIAEILPSPSLI